jgi:type IX secretion system PorP/SprF family membrane protein
MKRILVSVGTALAIYSNYACAQDVRFVQAINNPLLSNAAFTGLHNTNVRLNSSAAANGQTKVTKANTDFATTIDYNLKPAKWKHSSMGVGLMYSTKYVSCSNASFNSVGLSAAYHRIFKPQSNNRKSALSVGALAYIRQNDYALRFISADPVNTNCEEPFDLTKKTNFSYADINIGLLYTAQRGSKFSYYAGASWGHVTRPQENLITFMNKPKQNTNYVLLGGLNLKLTKRLTGLANARYYTEGILRHETLAGAAISILLNGKRAAEQLAKTLTVGGWFRINDALCPYVSLQWGCNKVGLSSGLNVSRFSPAIRTNPSIEISYTRTGIKPRNHTLNRSNFAMPQW